MSGKLSENPGLAKSGNRQDICLFVTLDVVVAIFLQCGRGPNADWRQLYSPMSSVRGGSEN